MILVRLIGGLGNQMFQYAAGRALAHRHDVPLKLDVSGFESYGLRRYELDAYPIEASLASPDDLASVQTAPPASLVTRLLRKAGLGRTSWNHYREPHFPFDADLARQPLPLFMDGYWQSETYFADIADLLRRELTPLEPLQSENAETAEKISRTTSVSLHVRRGDYVTNAHTNAYHGTCSLDYYRAAIAHIAQRVENPHLFVFSDDATWTRENLKSDLETTYVSANPPDKGFRDLHLMSLCRHHIIANSSFSWWGAWLNPKPDKIIIAPQRWFASSDNDTRDLVPASWVRL